MDACDDPLYVDDDVPICDSVAARSGVASVTGTTAPLDSPPSTGYRRFVRSYAAPGRRRLEEQFDARGTRRHQRTFDAGGQVIEDVAYDASGRVEQPPGYHVVADRDPNGRLMRETYVNPDGAVLRTDTYTYDADGFLVRIAMGTLGYRAFEYGSAGRLARKSVVQPGGNLLGETFALDYDDRGLVTRLIHLNVSVTSFDYSFF